MLMQFFLSKPILHDNFELVNSAKQASNTEDNNSKVL